MLSFFRELSFDLRCGEGFFLFFGPLGFKYREARNSFSIIFPGGKSVIIGRMKEKGEFSNFEKVYIYKVEDNGGRNYGR